MNGTDPKVSVGRLILVPAIVTLAITLLRLIGELQGWSPFLFNKAPGGGFALVGISWLPIVFGPYFAWKVGVSHRVRHPQQGPLRRRNAIEFSFADRHDLFVR